MSTQKLIVSRETYTKEGKDYFAYFVSGEIKGKPVRVGFQGEKKDKVRVAKVNGKLEKID